MGTAYTADSVIITSGVRDYVHGQMQATAITAGAQPRSSHARLGE